MKLGLSYFPTFYSLRKADDFLASFTQISALNGIPPRLVEIYDCYVHACLSGFSETFHTPLFRRIHKNSMSSNDMSWREILASDFLEDLFRQLANSNSDNRQHFNPSKKDFQAFLRGYLTSKQGKRMTYSDGQIQNLKHAVFDIENNQENIRFFQRIKNVVQSYDG